MVIWYLSSNNHISYSVKIIQHNSWYGVISLLPFLSEKHICILFLSKSLCLVNTYGGLMVLYETE